jgi:hypothetical protein
MRLDDVMVFDTFITACMFNEDSVEITFLEKHEQSENVMMARSMVLPINTDERAQIYAELQDRLRDLVDWGYIELRNPPKEYTEPPASGRDFAYRNMMEKKSDGGVDE